MEKSHLEPVFLNLKLKIFAENSASPRSLIAEECCVNHHTFQRPALRSLAHVVSYGNNWATKKNGLAFHWILVG